MMKTLRMGKFNKFLKERTAYPNSFPGAKTKQLNYATRILSDYQYDAAVTHAGINNLLSFNKRVRALLK